MRIMARITAGVFHEMPSCNAGMDCSNCGYVMTLKTYRPMAVQVRCIPAGAEHREPCGIVSILQYRDIVRPVRACGSASSIAAVAITAVYLAGRGIRPDKTGNGWILSGGCNRMVRNIGGRKILSHIAHATVSRGIR